MIVFNPMVTSKMFDSTGREIREGYFCSRYFMGYWFPDWIVDSICYEEGIVGIYKMNEGTVGAFPEDIRMG